MTLVAVPQHAKLGEGFSRRAQIEADAFHPGRRTNGSQSAASWLADLTDLRKLITLCGFCATKFNPKKHGYRRFYVPDHTGITDGYACSGVCDACRSRLIATGVAFVAEESYRLLCVDPIEERRRARLRARAAWMPTHRRGSRRPLAAAALQGG